MAKQWTLKTRERYPINRALGQPEAPTAHFPAPSWLAPRMGSVHLLGSAWRLCPPLLAVCCWQLGTEPMTWASLIPQRSG